MPYLFEILQRNNIFNQIDNKYYNTTIIPTCKNVISSNVFEIPAIIPYIKDCNVLFKFALLKCTDLQKIKIYSDFQMFDELINLYEDYSFELLDVIVENKNSSLLVKIDCIDKIIDKKYTNINVKNTNVFEFLINDMYYNVNLNVNYDIILYFLKNTNYDHSMIKYIANSSPTLFDKIVKDYANICLETSMDKLIYLFCENYIECDDYLNIIFISPIGTNRLVTMELPSVFISLIHQLLNCI